MLTGGTELFFCVKYEQEIPDEQEDAEESSIKVEVILKREAERLEGFREKFYDCDNDVDVKCCRILIVEGRYHYFIDHNVIIMYRQP